MNFITGKHMPRRTFLRGMGATVALPFLDAMTPAGRVKAAAADPTRLVCIEEVHGLAGCTTFGSSKLLYAPETTGREFTLVPDNPFSTVAEYRDYMTMVSNTDVRMAEALAPPEIGADHFRSSAVFLTQAHPKQTQGSDVLAGTSLDQLYAQRYGQEQAFPSMQFCIEALDQAGGCTYNYSCVYTDSISWASPTDPLPMIRDPRVAFDMLFGSGGTEEVRSARRQTRRSILDWIHGEITEMKNYLGPVDKQRLDRYLQNVQEVERRIRMVEARNTSGETRAMPAAPAGVPDNFGEHMKLLFDIQVLALEADLTRVISFKTGRDSDNRQFPESGTSKSFHPASHHGNNENNIIDFNKINKYRVGQMAYFLDKMKNTMDGDKSLLDKSMIIWGSPMADPNVHNHRRCPLVFFGKANGKLQGNLHLKTPDGTPMANPMLTAMHLLGMDDIKTFGDSTGEFALTL
jgi:hypothetical protein